MRAKKLLAMLLAVIMVVSMIPISAAAVGETVKITLKSTGTFDGFSKEIGVGSRYQGAAGGATTDYSKIEHYRNFETWSTAAMDTDGIYDKASLEANKGIYSTMLSSAKETGTVVTKDDTVYITVRVTSPDSKTGVVPQQVLVKYDAAAFEAPTAAEECVVNPLALGTIVDLSQIDDIPESDKKWGMLMDSAGKTYGSQWAMAPVTIRDNDTGSALEGTEHAFALQWSYPGNHASKVSPTGIDWDYAIPFKIKSSAKTGEYTFEAIAGTGGGAAIEIYIPNSDPDTYSSEEEEYLNSGDNSTLYNSATGVTLGSTTVQIINPSEEPNGTYDENSIFNNKNLPYVSETEATGENLKKHVDYLRFPEDETKFKINDEVVIYQVGEDGTYGEELGRTKITAENLVTITGDKNNYTVGTYGGSLLNAGNVALRLVETGNQKELTGTETISEALKGSTFTIPAGASNITFGTSSSDTLFASGNGPVSVNGLSIVKNGDESYTITVNDKITAKTEVKFTPNGGSAQVVTFEAFTPTASADGSYVKNEKQVYIARVDNTTNPSDKKDPSNPKEELKVNVNGEGEMFFSDDISVIPEGHPGSSRENPFEITIGTSVEDMLNLLSEQDSLARYVTAPVESGVRVQNTIPAQLRESWSNEALYKEGTKNEGGKLVYHQHGIFEIRNPYRGAFVDSVEYDQPDYYVVYSDSDSEYQDAEVVPEYGAVFYINVMPDPADYYFTGTDLYVTGKTRDYMSEGDKILLFKNGFDPKDPKNAEGGWASHHDAIGTVGAGDMTENLATLTGVGTGLDASAANHDVVLLAYLNKERDDKGGYDNASGLVQIRTMSEEDVIVSSDIELDTIVEPSETLVDMLEALDTVNFTVLGPVDSDTKELAVNTYPLNGAMLSAHASGNTTIKKLTNGAYVDFPNDTNQFDTNKVLDETYQINIKIPDNQESSYVYQGLLTHYDGEEINPVEFENPEEARKIQITAVVQNKIKLSNDVEVEVTENNPLAPGQKDTLVIRGDELGQLADALDDDPTQVILTLETKDGTIVSHAYGSLAGVSDIEVTPTTAEDGVGVDYTVYFPQTARDSGTVLDLFVTTIGSASQPLKADITVGKQEKFALFEVVQPTPDTVLVAKEDLADPENIQLADVVKHLHDTATVVGPMMKYGYYTGTPENPVQDPAATYTDTPLVSAPYGLADHWIADSSNYETGVKLTWNKDGHPIKWDQLDADNKNKGGPDKTGRLPVLILDESLKETEISQNVKVVEEKYDEDQTPPLSEILGHADTTVVNKPYPQDDVITVHNSTDPTYNGIIVDAYVLNGSSAQHVGSVTLGGSDDATPIELDEGLNIKTLLNALGGELYFTVRTDEIAPSDLEAGKKTYDVEPYVLWETSSITPPSLTMRTSEALAGDSGVKANIVNRLPSIIQGTAVHLTSDSEGNLVVREKSGTVNGMAAMVPDQVTVYPEVEKWLDKNTGEEISDEVTFNGVTDNNVYNYTLRAQYNPTTFLAGTAGEDSVPNSQVLAENWKGVEVNTEIWESIPEVTQPADYNITNDVAVTLNNSAREVTVVPAPATVTVVSNNTPGSPEDYTITVTINREAANFDVANADLILKYPTISVVEGKEVHGFNWFALETPFSSGNEVKITKVGDNATETTSNAGVRAWQDLSLQGLNFDLKFLGLDYTLNGQVEVFFKENTKNKSDGLTGDYVKAADSEILENTLVSTLNLSTGMILNKADLLSFVTGITKAVPTLASGNTVDEIALDNNWKLVNTTLSTDGKETVTGFGTDVLEAGSEGFTDGWQEALSKLPGTNAGYALVTNFNETALSDAKIVNDKKVAFVQIKLYNDNDPSADANPLQLTDGNSDLWLHGAEKTSLAYQELLRRTDITSSTGAEDIQKAIAKYRTDLIFYYNFENYEDHVKPYADNALAVDNISSLKVVGSDSELKDTALTTWLDGATVTVKQLTAKGEKIAITTDTAGVVDYIEPHHSDSASKYFVFNESVTRFIEEYVIRYTIVKGSEVYVADRKVKLIYRSGDLDANGLKTYDDVSRQQLVIAGASVFKTTDEMDEDLKEAYRNAGYYVADPDGNSLRTYDDVSLIQQMIAGADYTDKRW
ncbi:MAG: hypothetical protein J1E06_08340 [Acutalibacter sp.]|nr:hypothetical protein [Acutalibacter sp.]